MGLRTATRRKNPNDNDLAEVWRSAQRRRFDDLYLLLVRLLKHRPQLKLSIFFWR
jgi:hypothetical protein